MYIYKQFGFICSSKHENKLTEKKKIKKRTLFFSRLFNRSSLYANKAHFFVTFRIYSIKIHYKFITMMREKNN